MFLLIHICLVPRRQADEVYELWISGYDTDTDRIIQLMKNWLDQL